MIIWLEILLVWGASKAFPANYCVTFGWHHRVRDMYMIIWCVMLIVRGSSKVFGANYCVRGIQIEFRWLTLNWWCVDEHWVCFKQIERKNPPPPGNFFVGWFPNQEPGGRGPNLKNNPQNWSVLGIILQQGSSSSGFLVWKSPNKETPLGGGGVSFDQNGHWVDVDLRLVNMGDCILFT